MKSKKSASIVKLSIAGLALAALTLLSSCDSMSSGGGGGSRHTGGQHGGQHQKP